MPTTTALKSEMPGAIITSAAQRAVAPASPQPKYVKWFVHIGIDDIPLVGGKNASLGEMYRELTAQGVKVPNGFAITAEAYRYFLREAKLDEKIRGLLRDLDTGDLANLRQRGSQIRQAILAAELPRDLAWEITAAYDTFRGNQLHPADVAVRSSATAEDLPDASFAGQQEAYLNVQGHLALLDACKRSFASLFTDRAISYRVDKGFDHFKVALSIGVQRMVRADLAASGVMSTIDTETGFRDTVLLNAAYGLGENIVQGSVNPDEYRVFKPTLKTGFKPILEKIVGTKEFKLVYDIGDGKMVKNIPVPPGDRAKFATSDEEILQLARWACIIELILGVDRDSEIAAPIFDERNAAVKKMIAQVIAVCRSKKRKIGICGQAPSDYPEFAQFLVEQGIDSISLNPDPVMKTTLAILEKEKALKK